MTRVQFDAVLATTHFLPERGVAISREVLEQLAAMGDEAGDPIYREHGTELIGRVSRKEVRQRQDGEFELIGEGEVDLAEGETVEDLLKRGWSLGILEDSGDRRPDAVAVLGIDTLAYKDLGRDGARVLLDDASEAVTVDWYHQFSAVPDPALVVYLTANIWPYVTGLSQHAVWDGLKLAVGRLAGRVHGQAEFVTFRIQGQGVDLSAKIPTSPGKAPEVIEALFEGAARVLREGARARGNR